MAREINSDPNGWGYGRVTGVGGRIPVVSDIDEKVPFVVIPKFLFFFFPPFKVLFVFCHFPGPREKFSMR